MAAKKKTAKKVESKELDKALENRDPVAEPRVESKPEPAPAPAPVPAPAPKVESVKVELSPEPRNLTRERIAQSKNAPLAAKMVK